jgi:3-oxoacyl-[acyl-carrier-protein] synthase-3
MSRCHARAQVVAVGHYVPDRRLTNADLERMVDTNDAWIIERTGIRERRIAAPGQALSDLAIPAARNCLAQATLSGENLDGIIVATSTPDTMMPACANIVQHAVGAGRSWAFDLVNACNGFTSALASATAFIEAGRARRILVVGGDLMSSIIDWKDRNTCVLFGDGAGAVLVEAGPADGAGILGFHMGSDGEGAPLLCIPASGSRLRPTAEVLGSGAQFLKQDGRRVFTHAIRRMCEAAECLLADLGLTQDDVDLVVPHQANLRIIEALAERLGLPMERVMVNIDHFGNTTAGTIPLALSEAQEQGRLRDGTRVLILTFGAGFSWGACYLRWGR